MSGRFSFSYFSSAYFSLLVFSLFHLCLSNKNFDVDVLCLDGERQALVQFKQGLVDEIDRLASWVDGEERDCCRWAGIGCDNITGHVHRIHLPGFDGHCPDYYDYNADREYEEASKQKLRGKLSSSLLHLKQLRHLDLSCNDFGMIKVPKFIGSLTNFRYLNLSRSNFSGMIPPQLGNLSELQVLGLGSFHSYNVEKTSMVNMEWLSSLRMLLHLDMSGVNLNKASGWLPVINTLFSLVQLHISGCELSNIHPHVASLNLTSLSILDLSFNSFNTLVAPWIFSVTSLVMLDLTRCNFHGPTPRSVNSFRNLTSLESLHVWDNNFMNSSLVLKGLSSTIGGNLISLDISNCGISSSVLDSLYNLTSLLSLDMSGNQLTERIPKSLGNFCSLREIDLSYNMFGNNSLTYLLENFFKCKSPCLESLRSSLTELSGPIPYSIGRFSFLRSLDFSQNLISGLIPSSIGELSSLEELYLSSNQLNDSLPDSLGQLIHLRCLQLDLNHISGTIPDSIRRLSFLTSLDLSENLISGPIPSSIGQISSLKKLNLFNNQLNGGIPYSIGRLSSLEVLDLSNNRLDGNLPYSIGRLSSLEELDLRNNQLDGSLPCWIGRLSSLARLSISHNQLNGSLPTCLGQLLKLKFLDISSNLLTGVVTDTHFSKLMSLAYLDGGGNNFTLRSGLQNWIPHFHLYYLYLNSWDLGPRFPLWLQSQKNLMFLDISNKRISSLPPESFWRSLPNLVSLDMSRNQIQGTLTLSSIPETLMSLDLSYNKLSGQLTHISNISLLYILDLSNNFFIGSIQDLLCSNGVKNTFALYLGNNHLSGVIPECWDKWSLLNFLEMENNNLSGGIPTTLGFSSQLQSLNVRGNKLSGRLPASIMNLTNLQILQLDRNKLVGSIPSWFGIKLPSLRILNFRSNNFVGIIPHELCYLKHIQILDLAHNNLSGNIPSCFNNFSVLTGKETIQSKELNFNGVSGREVLVSVLLVMKGREDTYNSSLGLVTSLDLSSNNLVGNIPSELTSLRELKSLNFSRNQLTGRIPEKTGDMKSLETFDLSLNKLFGELPVSLSQLNFLSSLNVSYNNLTGIIPTSTQLQSFNESSFLGNKLCGPPLITGCVSVEIPKKTCLDQQGDDGTDLVLIISIVVGFVSGFLIIVAPPMVIK